MRLTLSARDSRYVREQRSDHGFTQPANPCSFLSETIPRTELHCGAVTFASLSLTFLANDAIHNWQFGNEDEHIL